MKMDSWYAVTMQSVYHKSWQVATRPAGQFCAASNCERRGIRLYWHNMNRARRIIGGYAALQFMVLLACGAAQAEVLQAFTSDGCSLFPDGTIEDRTKWCECCLQHDLAYWRGGTEQERKQSDMALRDCVLDRTGDRALAETMYLGVRAGGHPAVPAGYRWAYGWSYGRGYRPLNDEERAQVRALLDASTRDHPGGYCAEQRGTVAPRKEGTP